MPSSHCFLFLALIFYSVHEKRLAQTPPRQLYEPLYFLENFISTPPITQAAAKTMSTLAKTITGLRRLAISE